jgi:hypothetical protein
MKGNLIKRYLPGFIDHDEEDLVEVHFNTTEELLNIEWIKTWRDHPGFNGYRKDRAINFGRFNGIIFAEIVADTSDNKVSHCALGFLEVVDYDSIILSPKR